MKIINNTEGKYSTTYLRRMVAWCERLFDIKSTARPATLTFVMQGKLNSGASSHTQGGAWIVRLSSTFEGGILDAQNTAWAVLCLHGRMNNLSGDSHFAGVQFASHESELLAKWRDSDQKTTIDELYDAAFAKLADPKPAKPAKPKPSLIERRLSKAQDHLDNWKRKHKLASTKVKKYQRKVRSYENRLKQPALT